MLITLERLGLTRLDAQVYILLGKKGPLKAKDITKSLRVPKQTLYRSIKDLQNKAIITATLEHPAKFVAAPFDRVLDLFVKAKTEEINRIEEDKKSLLADWQSISITEVGDHSPRFTVIEGKNYIYPRLKQMVEDSKSQLSLAFTFPGLIRSDQFGLVESVFRHAKKASVSLKFLTELNQGNLSMMKHFLNEVPAGIRFEGRTPELGIKLVSRMLIKDDAEIAFFVGQETEGAGESDDVCLWTNSGSIVKSFKVVFDDLWQNSIDVKIRIDEIEKGKPTKKTCILGDAETAEKKYNEAIKIAKAEIIMMTSSAGLLDLWERRVMLKERSEEGVSIKIMAPVRRENLKIALHLSECCKVRHIPTSYLRTLIIDGSTLFQFKNPSSNNRKLKGTSSFENTFFSNDVEYIERIKNMLDDAWENAVVPSSVTLEDITKPQVPVLAPVPDNEYTLSRKDSPYQKNVVSINEKPEAKTEQEILNKIINARRFRLKDLRKDFAMFFGSAASAVIRSPQNFNLPDMHLMFFHLDKKSTFGAEDCFQVHLWLKMPKGYAFVPVAFVGDNPASIEWRKSFLANTPAGKNIIILRKDELQIQMHGNTMFAGWAVPIPLFPPQYVLPPASLLFEGYGKLKTAVTTVVFPSGAKSVMEGNGFDTFVTFFHPESKYAGPGTDGTMARDLIITTYPTPTNPL